MERYIVKAYHNVRGLEEFYFNSVKDFNIWKNSPDFNEYKSFTLVIRRFPNKEEIQEEMLKGVKRFIPEKVLSDLINKKASSLNLI